VSVPAQPPTLAGVARRIAESNRVLDERPSERMSEEAAERERELDELEKELASAAAALAELERESAEAVESGIRSREEIDQILAPFRQSLAERQERFAYLRTRQRKATRNARELARLERRLAEIVGELEARFAVVLERVEARGRGARPRELGGNRRRATTGKSSSGTDPPSPSPDVDPAPPGLSAWRRRA
jgi:hypothetical protein